MEERELFDRFVDTSLPADQFHHQQHLHVAWLFVRARYYSKELLASDLARRTFLMPDLI